jgi:hypothetical protein
MAVFQSSHRIGPEKQVSGQQMQGVTCNPSGADDIPRRCYSSTVGHGVGNVSDYFGWDEREEVPCSGSWGKELQHTTNSREVPLKLSRPLCAGTAPASLH